MFRHLGRTQFLAAVAITAAASTLLNCSEDSPVPNAMGGSGGSSGTGGASAGTGGASAGTGGGSGSSAGGASGSQAGGTGGSGMGGKAGSGGGGKAGAGGANTGGGGSGGAAGGGGSGGGGSGSMCGKATITVNDAAHVPSDLTDLAALINGPNATVEPYALAPAGGGGHTHIFTFTEPQVMTLRDGGMVTVEGLATEGHGHQVTVSCTKL